MSESRKDAEETDAALSPRPDVGQGTITPHADPTATVDGPSRSKHEDVSLTDRSQPGQDCASPQSSRVISDQTTDQPASVSTSDSGFSGGTLDYVPKKAPEPAANGGIYLGETVDQVSAMESAHSAAVRLGASTYCGSKKSGNNSRANMGWYASDFDVSSDNAFQKIVAVADWPTGDPSHNDPEVVDRLLPSISTNSWIVTARSATGSDEERREEKSEPTGISLTEVVSRLSTL